MRQDGGRDPKHLARGLERRHAGDRRPWLSQMLGSDPRELVTGIPAAVRQEPDVSCTSVPRRKLHRMGGSPDLLGDLPELVLGTSHAVIEPSDELLVDDSPQVVGR